jgi:uncharacterized phage-associated protein
VAFLPIAEIIDNSIHRDYVLLQSTIVNIIDIKEGIMTKAIEVAEYIISYFSNIVTNPIEGDLTNLKLQKLLYYTQVLSLKRLKIFLFDDEIEAWEYGPVVPSVYHQYKSFGRDVLDITNPNLLFKPVDKKNIIDEVIKDKGRFTGIALMEMTHQEMPWKIARNSDDKIITLDLISQDIRNKA